LHSSHICNVTKLDMGFFRENRFPSFNRKIV
jgi:hypothetical protein